MHETNNVLHFLINVAADALLLLFLLRLFAELFRVDFHNQFSQVIYRYSNPLIRPLRQYIPNYKRWNMAAVLMTLLVVVLKWVILLKTQNMSIHWPGLLLLSAGEALDFALFVYMIMIFAWAISSFLTTQRQDRGPHPVMQFVEQLVNPLMQPLRQRMPSMGGIDFSPTVAIIVVIVARMVVAAPIIQHGKQLLFAGA